MNIIIAGDYCPQDRIKDINSTTSANVFRDIIPITTRSDYNIVNFECSIGLRDEKKIDKCGPNLYCSLQSLEALKTAGFDCVTLANNHIYDYGDTGVLNTIRYCENLKIDIVGGGASYNEASKTLYKTVKCQTLAIINCCEHEFSIATEKKGGANPLNPIQQFYAIREAKSKADYLIVIVHGGHELYNLPSPRMKELYKFFIEIGADAVINHHQHCYSGYEIYKGKPIFYGLGNFCFDRSSERNSIWNEGYLVSVQLFKEHEVEFQLIPYKQCNDEPIVRLMNENEKEIFSQQIHRLNKIILDDALLEQEYHNWTIRNRQKFLSIFQPYTTRLLNSLYCRGLLPSFMNKKKKLRIIDYLNCESHLDELRYHIESI